MQKENSTQTKMAVILISALPFPLGISFIVAIAGRVILGILNRMFHLGLGEEATEIVSFLVTLMISLLAYLYLVGDAISALKEGEDLSHIILLTFARPFSALMDFARELIKGK